MNKAARVREFFYYECGFAPIIISLNKNKKVEFIDNGGTVRVIGKEFALTMSKTDFERAFKVCE